MIIAIAGATGSVGRVLIAELERAGMDGSSLLPLATERSAGSRIDYGRDGIEVAAYDLDRVREADLAFLSAGSGVGREAIPLILEAGVVAIDNSSPFRMYEHTLRFTVDSYNAISCLIPAAQEEEAVRALHRAFFESPA